MTNLARAEWHPLSEVLIHRPGRAGDSSHTRTAAPRDRGIEVVPWSLWEITGGDGGAKGMSCIINRTSS